MKRIIQINLLIILMVTACTPSEPSIQYAETILMDAGHLADTKDRLENDDLQLKHAYTVLLQDANQALNEGPFSVTQKEKLPPSGNKNDYASYSRYWWPNPDQTDGLPYMRRDGVTNPNSQSPKTSDRPRIGKLGENSESLGLAYYFTGDEKYAKKVAELLRSWFLEPSTRMNPNLNHAQCRPGHNEGSKSGVLDGRLLVQALEGSLLISNSNELSEDEYIGLKTWAKEYLGWLTTNKMALQEAAAKNNHGSFYDVQAMYFALYVEDHETATKIATNFAQNRVVSQIESDGSMPEEMARTRPLFYSIYNLHAMCLVAHLAQKVDIDIWKTEDRDSHLRLALEYLIPYTDSQRKWPHPTIGETDRLKMFPILQMADLAYPESNYLEEAEKLEKEELKTLRTNLAFPLMR